MNIDKTVSFIADFEGFRSRIYDDGFGNKTIGFGHLCTDSSDFSNNTKLTLDEAYHILKLDVLVAWQSFEGFLVKVGLPGFSKYLNDEQCSAVCSLIFNIGISKFQSYSISGLICIYLYTLKCNRKYSFLKDLEEEIILNFKAINKAGGHVVKGLQLRRNKEANNFKFYSI